MLGWHCHLVGFSYSLLYIMNGSFSDGITNFTCGIIVHYMKQVFDDPRLIYSYSNVLMLILWESAQLAGNEEAIVTSHLTFL